MTIHGSRRAAAGVALAGVAVLVVVGLSALLLREPRFLLLVGLLAAIQLAVVLWLLRPTALSFDGTDVIYRVGGRETRTACSDIASCALIGRGWVFSDSAGAQLLSLPALQFTETDVAAFCKRSRLDLRTPPPRPLDQRRRDVSSAKVTRAMGLILTLPLLIFAAFAIWASYSAQDALSRYQSAPACAEGAQTTSTCRLQTQARVTSTEAHQTSTDLHLTRIGAGGDYVAAVRNPSALTTGDVVNVEVWSGKVTRLEGKDTLGNPEVNPNLNIVGVVGVIGLFAALSLGMAVAGHLQLKSARAGLRAVATAEGGSVGPVQAVHPDAAITASGLPPCGIAHQPKEVFFAHWDPKVERTGLVVVLVVAAVVLAVLALLAVKVSVPIFGGLAALGVAWLGLNLFGEWRERRVGGVFADDLHVGKTTTSNGRLVRKVYERTSVLQCTIESRLLTVVGVDGSTLFWTGGLASQDVDRFVAFLGCRTVRDAPPEQPDPIASAAVKTPLGVLPLRVRRAAGLMQSIGGLMLGLAVINVLRFLGLSAALRLQALELLASMAVYGGAMVWSGLRLARGRPHSREAALIGGGIATVFLLVVQFVVFANLALSAILTVVTLPIYGLVFSWLRKPVKL